MVSRGRLSFNSIFLFILLILAPNLVLGIDIIEPTHSILNSLEFNISISTQNATECFYDYSEIAHENKTHELNQNSSNTFTAKITESYDAQYEYYISCKYNTSNETLIKNTLLEITIDSTKPQIIDYKPKEIVTQDTYLLSVTVTKPASCRYSQNNISYFAMTQDLADNGDNTHYKQIEYSFDGKRSYYVDCIDTSGNTLEDRFKISVEHAIPPIGQIIFDKNPPFTQGTYKITLLTSKEVQQTPSLSYTFDGVKENYIPLTGSKSTWSGYMVINEVEKSNALVGSFNFNSVDLKGTIGTLISKNKIFLVDTKSPEQIRNLRAVSKENGHIRLVWNYDDLSEEIDYFKIYRSSLSNINKLDYYDKTSKEYFLDDAIIPGRTYYYSVSAIDMAGNEAPLSVEVEIESVLDESLLSDKSKPKVEQDPLKSKKISQAKDQISNIITQIDSIAFEDENTQDFLETLNLNRISSDSKNILTQLITQLDETLILDEPEFTKKINEIVQKANSEKAKIPKKITFQGTLDLTISQDNYEEIIKATLDSYRLSYDEEFEKEYEKFEKQTRELSSSLDVKSTATKIIVTYLDSKNKEFLKIDKSIELKDLEQIPQNTFLIEKIPKEIASATSEIIFDKTQNIETIKASPILKIPFQNSKQFSYIITKSVSENILQNSFVETYLIADPLKNYLESENNENSITGNVISGNVSIKPNILFTILGVIMILGLGGYYFTLDKNISLKDFSIKNIISKNSINNKKSNDFSPEKNQNTDFSYKQNMSPNEQMNLNLNTNSTSFENSKHIPNNLNQNNLALDNSALTKVIELCNTVVTQNYSLINTQNNSSSNKQAIDIFKNCNPENAFILENNIKINNIIELLESVDELDSEEFHGYLVRNDFSNWVKNSLDNYKLSESLKDIQSKSEFKKVIYDELKRGKKK